MTQTDRNLVALSARATALRARAEARHEATELRCLQASGQTQPFPAIFRPSPPVITDVETLLAENDRILGRRR